MKVYKKILRKLKWLYNLPLSHARDERAEFLRRMRRAGDFSRRVAKTYKECYPLPRKL